MMISDVSRLNQSECWNAQIICAEVCLCVIVYLGKYNCLSGRWRRKKFSHKTNPWCHQKSKNFLRVILFLFLKPYEMGWRVCSCGRNACKVSLTVDEKETDDIILTMKCIWHYRREKWLGHHDTGGKSERSTGTNLCDRPKGFSLLCMGGRAGKLVNLATGKEYKTRFLVLQIQYENLIMESSFLWQPCFWSLNFLNSCDT